jgi:hypothetical protein
VWTNAVQSPELSGVRGSIRRRADLGAHVGKVPPVGREAAPWKPAMNSPDCEIEWIIVCNDVCTPRLTGCVFLVLSPTAAVLAL